MQPAALLAKEKNITKLWLKSLLYRIIIYYFSISAKFIFIQMWVLGIWGVGVVGGVHFFDSFLQVLTTTSVLSELVALQSL